MFASVRGYYVHVSTPRPGFVAYDFMDCGDGEAMSISVFREAAQAHDSRELARRWTERHLADIELTTTDSLHGLVVESRGRGGDARWASVHGHRASSAAGRGGDGAGRRG